MELQASKLMTVPNHFIPMQFPYNKSIIYIRDCYPIYFDSLWNDLFVGDQIDSVLITGTSGIGKSIFYIYVLERMKILLKDKVFVLASFSNLRRMNYGLILTPGKEPIRLGKNEEIPFIENAVYLYDGNPD
jgi:hypothetical protein